MVNSTRKKNEKLYHPLCSQNWSKRLKLFSFENDLILDPFNGVGTTTKVHMN